MANGARATAKSPRSQQAAGDKAAAEDRGAGAPLDIVKLRAQIDAVDARIHALLNDRARLARQVGISKHADGHTVDFYRPEREAQVLRMARERNKGPLRTEEILRLFREIMSACLAQEEPLKVGFLGPEGTFSQTATLKHFGHSVRALALVLGGRGVPRGGSGARGFRRGAGGELHRRLGQSHARFTARFAAADLR